MLLNLLRVEEADPEYMMQRSFYQFQQNRSVPQLDARKYFCKTLCLLRVLTEQYLLFSREKEA